jgi:hypothetical protein
VQGKPTLVHDILRGFLRQAVCWGGIHAGANTLHSARPQGWSCGGTPRRGLLARGHILLALVSGLTVVDVTHPPAGPWCGNRAAAVASDTAAAARRDVEKWRAENVRPSDIYH